MEKQYTVKEYSNANYYMMDYEYYINKHKKNKIINIIDSILIKIGKTPKFYKDLENKLYKEFNLTFIEAQNILTSKII